FLREHGIAEEEAGLHLPLIGNLVGKIIDDTKVKEPRNSSTPFLSQAEHNARDYSWRYWTFGMFELQLRIGGRTATTKEIFVLEELYFLIESAMMMFKVGPTFEDPLDDDDPKVLTNLVDDEE
ncbi:hypothetical protein HAX54_009578, partial [Datura stramonium]|nr:hypothetical protein [Datura stramonium]